MESHQGKVTPPYTSKKEIKNAAVFIASLIENSTVVFETKVEYRVRENIMVIWFNGGY